MSLLALAGWFLLGAVVATCLVTFWDDVKNWLNNTAANFIERKLGYGARARMHRAVSRVDRFMDKVRNRAAIYMKRNELDTYFEKTTMVAEAQPYEIGQAVLNEIDKNNELVQEFGYRS